MFVMMINAIVAVHVVMVMHDDKVFHVFPPLKVSALY